MPSRPSHQSVVIIPLHRYDEIPGSAQAKGSYQVFNDVAVADANTYTAVKNVDGEQNQGGYEAPSSTYAAFGFRSAVIAKGAHLFLTVGG